MTPEVLAAWAAVILTAAGGLFAFFKWREESREQRALRAQELRWQKARMAKEALDEMLHDDYVQAVFRMLDWDGLEYDIGGSKQVEIYEEDYVRAMRTQNLNFSALEVYVRDAFDALFSHLARLEHYVRSELVTIEDVSHPLDYYLPTLKRNGAVFEAFMSFYHLDRAAAFLKRLDAHLHHPPSRPSWREMRPTP